MDDTSQILKRTMVHLEDVSFTDGFMARGRAEFCKGERERESERREREKRGRKRGYEREERERERERARESKREDMRESESEVIMELVEGWFMSVQLPLMSFIIKILVYES